MLQAKDWWWNSSYQQAFIRIKQRSHSVQDNVQKKYYVILLPRTLVIFFWDGHGFILKRLIFMNVPFIWGMRDMKWSWNWWHQDDQHRLKEKIEKERIEKEEIYNAEEREIEEKQKEVKIKMMEKEGEKQGV